MPRIRTLKPEHKQHRKIGPLSDRDYRLWVGLVTEADDAGRLVADPGQLCALVFPYHPRVTAAQLGAALDRLAALGLIRLYTVAGTRYADLPSWRDHQRISHPAPSMLPANNDSLNHPESSGAFQNPPEPSGTFMGDRKGSERRGTDRKGGESEGRGSVHRVIHNQAVDHSTLAPPTDPPPAGLLPQSSDPPTGADALPLADLVAAASAKASTKAATRVAQLRTAEGKPTPPPPPQENAQPAW